MRRTRDISIIIPAAGMGRRMNSYGPKSLIELPGGQNVISRQLGLIREAYPKAEIIVVLGFGCDRILRYLPPDVKVVENEKYADTNVARSIAMGLRVASHKHVLIIYGDLVFNAETIAGLVGVKSAGVIDRSGQLSVDEVGVMVCDGKITNFEYELPDKWAQILFLTGLELELFRKFSSSRERRKWFGYEILNRIIDHGGSFKAVEPKEMRIAEIDFSRDIEHARKVSAYANAH